MTVTISPVVMIDQQDKVVVVEAPEWAVFSITLLQQADPKYLIVGLTTISIVAENGTWTYEVRYWDQIYCGLVCERTAERIATG